MRVSVSVRSTYIPAEKAPERLFRYRYIKRAADILLIALASPILLPVFAVIAAAVRFYVAGTDFLLSSPHPPPRRVLLHVEVSAPCA